MFMFRQSKYRSADGFIGNLFLCLSTCCTQSWSHGHFLGLKLAERASSLTADSKPWRMSMEKFRGLRRPERVSSPLRVSQSMSRQGNISEEGNSADSAALLSRICLLGKS